MPWGRKLERALHIVFALIAVVWVLLGLLMVFIHMTEPADAAALCEPASWPPVPTIKLQTGELALFTRTVFAESRGEPFCGQVSVAATVVNRLKFPQRYGASIGKIIRRPAAFSVWLPGDGASKLAKIDESDAGYMTALLAVLTALAGVDPVQGATHFYHVDMKPAPYWAPKMVRVGRIGQHIFMREE